MIPRADEQWLMNGFIACIDTRSSVILKSSSLDNNFVNALDIVHSLITGNL